jgi:transcription-repair coupling factor (superfamily II helicase)
MSLLTVYGAPEGWDAALLIRRLLESDAPMIHVARDDARLARMADALAFFAPERPVLRFPAWDCLPYDRVSPNPAIVSERIATLARLAAGGLGQGVVLTTVNALVQRVPPRGMFRGSSLSLKPGGVVQPEVLATYLEAHGYARAATVMEPGEFAMRGGIVDLFPAGEPEPIRLDLFGDSIESMRRFDPNTQRSGEAVNCIPCPRCRWIPRASRGSARPGARSSARRRRTTRSTTRSPTGGGIRAWSIGCRCSMTPWKRCSTTCPAPPSRSTIRRRRCWSPGWR